MKYSANKRVDELVRQLIKKGWEFRWGGKHGRLKPPHGMPILTVPSTPSDRRAFANFKGDVRRLINHPTY